MIRITGPLEDKSSIVLRCAQTKTAGQCFFCPLMDACVAANGGYAYGARPLLFDKPSGRSHVRVVRKGCR